MEMESVPANNYPMEMVQYKLKDALGLESLGSLLSAGIKFFLCQRQQIPVPFERLYTAKLSSPVIGSSNSDAMTTTALSNPSLVPDNLDNPMDRIRFLRNLRKGSRSGKLATGRSYKSMREESRAKDTLDKIFDDIKILFRNSVDLMINSPETKLKSLVLHFGANIYNPKETIVFQIPYDVDAKGSNIDDLTKITKTFYKSIIMSPLFPNFVDKPLRSTYTHIMLITQNPLPECFRMEHGLIPLEYSSLWSEFSNQKSSRKRKQLFINIEPEEKSELVDILSQQHYYQLPLHFKGVRK